MKNIIKEYAYIYSSVEKSPKKIELPNFILKKNKNQYFLIMQGIYLSDCFLNLSIVESKNPNSDAHFIIFIIFSCFDVDLKFSVISKTKFIIMLNMIRSNCCDRSIFLKKILKVHGVSKDLVESSFLFFDRKLVYLKDGVSFNLKKISTDLIKNNKNIKPKNKQEIKNNLELFFRGFKNKSKKQSYNFKFFDYDEILSGVVDNKFDITSMILEYMDIVVDVFEYCLDYYRILTWESPNFEYMSMYYNHKKIDDLVGVLEKDDCIIRFECEYFIESFVLNIGSIEMIDCVISKIKNNNNIIKFKFIIYKSGFFDAELKNYMKKDILKYTK